MLKISESISGRLVPNKEEVGFLSGEQTKSEKQIEQNSNLDSNIINKNDNASQSNDDIQKSTASKPNRNENVAKNVPSISPESDLVSSTYKEDEEISSQPTQSQSEHKENDTDFDASDEKSESTAYEESEVSHSEQTDSKSESTFVSQDTSEENQTNNERTSDDYDPDDSDNVRERRNPKFSSEREAPQQFDDNSKPKNFPPNFQRNRHQRPQMPRHPYGGPGDFNPSQFMPQYRGARRPMLPGPQPEFMRGHTISMMRGPPNHMQRMPPGMQPHPSRMPVGPGHLPPHQRMARPPFQSPAMFGNNPGMPPQGKT